MKVRDRQLAWIGAIGGFTGLMVASFWPDDELLPINRVLFALVSALMIIWLLLRNLDGGRKPRGQFLIVCDHRLMGLVASSEAGRR